MFTLTMDRKQCAELLIKFDEWGTQANLVNDAENSFHEYPYKLILLNYVNEAKALNTATHNKTHFENTKIAFTKSLELTALANEHDDVQDFRRRISVKEFLRHILPYSVSPIFLFILN